MHQFLARLALTFRLLPSTPSLVPCPCTLPQFYFGPPIIATCMIAGVACCIQPLNKTARSECRLRVPLLAFLLSQTVQCWEFGGMGFVSTFQSVHDGASDSFAAPSFRARSNHRPESVVHPVSMFGFHATAGISSTATTVSPTTFESTVGRADVPCSPLCISIQHFFSISVIHCSSSSCRLFCRRAT